MTPAAASSTPIAGPADTERVRRHLEGILGVPATEGNLIEILRNGDEIFPAMLEAIDQADHTIDLLTFVYWEGQVGTEFAARLVARAQAGVRVRVLLDSWGARPVQHTLVEQMEAGGVQVRWFRPLRVWRPTQINHRTHRKVLITDEAIAFTGGVGIADEWLGDARDDREWRDTHFRVTGPAVDGLRAAFLDNWAETDTVLFDSEHDRFPEQPQPGGAVVQCIRSASEAGFGDVDMLIHALLQMATTRVRIATAYFVPDDDLTRRLCETAERGVDVEILVPGPHADKRFVQLGAEAAFSELLDHHVSIWRFQPCMLHTKVMTVDGRLANVGSANLNARSVALDEEVNLVVLDTDITATLDRQFDEDLERSIQIDPARWADRRSGQRLAETIVGPLRRLF
jgi:cardiolipin synthase A/B